MPIKLRPYHFPEIALTEVTNDLHIAAGLGQFSVLLFLHLSVASDSAGHSLLLK